VSFPQSEGCPQFTGRLDPGAWRDPASEDVAFLRLEPVPAGSGVLGLRATPGPVGGQVRAFGFPVQAPPDGHPGAALVGESFTVGRFALLELTAANDLAQGSSGSPVVDSDGLVVAMVTAFPGDDVHGKGADMAYATPRAPARSAIAPVCPHGGPGVSLIPAGRARASVPERPSNSDIQGTRRSPDATPPPSCRRSARACGSSWPARTRAWLRSPWSRPAGSTAAPARSESLWRCCAHIGDCSFCRAPTHGEFKVPRTPRDGPACSAAGHGLDQRQRSRRVEIACVAAVVR
jgi:hypothetical protein